jgi:hypothetical protein
MTRWTSNAQALHPVGGHPKVTCWQPSSVDLSAGPGAANYRDLLLMSVSKIVLLVMKFTFSLEMSLVVDGVRICRRRRKGWQNQLAKPAAEAQTFLTFVEEARESNYLTIEIGEEENQLRMFKSAETASPGAFRYDLSCETRN